MFQSRSGQMDKQRPVPLGRDDDARHSSLYLHGCHDPPPPDTHARVHSDDNTQLALHLSRHDATETFINSKQQTYCHSPDGSTIEGCRDAIADIISTLTACNGLYSLYISYLSIGYELNFTLHVLTLFKEQLNTTHMDQVCAEVQA